MPEKYIETTGFLLQENPKIFVSSIPGRWLLAHTTPSWRIKEPALGFQRMIKEDRAKEIAISVLEQHRTFPNAIVLATDSMNLVIKDEKIEIPEDTQFLIVDGQHRLWAQNFSSFDANYACMIHLGLSEVEMAELFLEINDNQKRVPSSLRWDLVRLVRPDDDPYGIATTEMIYLLATEEDSPLFQRIDLTGEQSEIQLKQASIAPEIKLILSKKSKIHDLTFDEQHSLIQNYIYAIKSLDPDNWGNPVSTFFKARVLRALLKLFLDILTDISKPVEKINFADFYDYLRKIDPQTLDTQKILAAQGSAGIKNIYDTIHNQIFK